MVAAAAANPVTSMTTNVMVYNEEHDGEPFIYLLRNDLRKARFSEAIFDPTGYLCGSYGQERGRPPARYARQVREMTEDLRANYFSDGSRR